MRRVPDLGKTIDPVKFVHFFPMLGPELNNRLHLFYWSVGSNDGLLECLHDAKKVFDEKGVKTTWIERLGYGHEWSFWRLDLQDFSARLFKPNK
jgi:S-formylglutathione hydrolase FrmB